LGLTWAGTSPATARRGAMFSAWVMISAPGSTWKMSHSAARIGSESRSGVPATSRVHLRSR
jgi:hypothetical protein